MSQAIQVTQAKESSESLLDLINDTSREEIDLWVAKYPAEQKQSAVMTALRVVQDQHGGWLTTELMDAVALYLDMDKIHVYEVATFYSMYEHKPVGKHKICVCTNISCMSCGSAEIVDHLKDRLEIKMGDTTADKRFTLKEVECLGACSGAPMLQIGENYYENLDAAKIDKILSDLD